MTRLVTVAAQALFCLTVGALAMLGVLLIRYPETTTLTGLIHAGRPAGDIIVCLYYSFSVGFSLWSWRVIQQKLALDGGRSPGSIGAIGFGGALLVIMSVDFALRDQGGYWVTALGQPTFYVRFFCLLLSAPFVYLWAGYWWGKMTLSMTKSVLGKKD